MYKFKRMLKFILCFYGLHLCAEYQAKGATENLSTSVQLLGCNPLKDLNTFAIHPQYSIASSGLRTKVNEIVERELKKVGKVVTLSVPDSTGYGKSQANITMLFEEAPSFNEHGQSISEFALLISSPTTIEKTNVKCTTYIWSAHSFIDGAIVDRNEKNISLSVNNLIDKFIKEYREANKDYSKKPTFYIYK